MAKEIDTIEYSDETRGNISLELIKEVNGVRYYEDDIETLAVITDNKGNNLFVIEAECNQNEGFLILKEE